MAKIFFSQHHVSEVPEQEALSLEQAGLIRDDFRGGYYPEAGVTVEEIEGFLNGI